jgi:DNA-directed RNA polymerase subunit RPC12/RpoP
MIVCPHCGSKDYEVFNETYNDNEYVELCVCLDCDREFQAVYELKEVKVI